MVAGLGMESSVESCSNDIGDVLAIELGEPDDNPRTTIGTFSVLHCIFCRILLSVALDHLSTHNIHDLRRVFQAIRLRAYSRGSILSRVSQDRRRTMLLLHLFALFHRL